MNQPPVKPLRWVASARNDLRAFPPGVRQVMGTALYLAQTGGKHPRTKPFKGVVRGSGVLEIVDDHDSNTFRTIYTVRFEPVIYVLHAFQKKSKKGIKTPQRDVDLIRARYELARMDYETEFGATENKGGSQ
jgi:phage-related protein